MTISNRLSRGGDRGQRRKATLGGAAVALGALAIWVADRARRAELSHPPRGALLTVDGVRLHYLERGQGTPVVLLHGNVVHAEDFVVSGLIDRLAAQHRVIAFDRPGFGHSARPRDRLWTAAAQAALLDRALAQLGVEHAVVLGHSWGTLVALELALRAYTRVRKLVLVSGYYFPTARADVVLAAPPAIPVVGDVMRYTLSPVFARVMLKKTIQAMFTPQVVPADFLPVLGRELLVRPSQIRANAEDAAFMIPAAARLRKRYGELKTPTTIFAGETDPVVDPERHARRLHTELSNSELHVLPGVGHMLHHAAPGAVVAAVGAG
ncbi:MAG: alpha/beta hydrolase [Pseudomonadota bacterium]|nr:alpha/beta hydrolase [Pseudomonadota bacterium]